MVTLPKARAAAHAALRATTTAPGSRITAAVGHVATDHAQELGELRAVAAAEETKLLEAAIQSPTSFNMQNWRL